MTSPANPLPGRNFYDETGVSIVPGPKLGEGGEGVVYLVEGDPGSVMKIWHPGRTPQDATAKIRHMVKNPVRPELGASWYITWPQRVVMEKRVIVGYTMPILAPEEEWNPIVEYYNRLAARSTGAAQRRELDFQDRMRMARNLAIGFRAVHDAGYVIGDVNEKNVEVNRLNDIALVDCDSYGFTDSANERIFSNRMGRPEFQAPELAGNYENRTRYHDLFGLAVLIFQLLTGYHPYTVTNQPKFAQTGARIRAGLFPPAMSSLTAPDPYTQAWNALPSQQRELFLRCFDKTYLGQLRPTPEEWVETLSPRQTSGRPQPSPGPRPALANLVRCPKCGRNNDQGLIYCVSQSCIAPLSASVKTCACRASIPVNSSYCPQCGQFQDPANAQADAGASSPSGSIPCPSCRTQVPLSSVYCGRCGTNVR